MTQNSLFTSSEKVDRFYIRCKECLSIGCVAATPKCDRLKWGEKWANILEWTCGVCGGSLELMGKVTQDDKHIEREEERTPCDKRCTHAIGPLCVCKCSCANHGTGRTVTLKVIEEKPIIDFKAEAHALEHLATYKRECERVRKVLEARPKGYISYELYRKWNGFKIAFGKALAARKHETRIKYLNQITL
jgi:hypothetical protein